MRRRVPFLAAATIVLVAALAIKGDRLAAAAGAKRSPSAPMKQARAKRPASAPTKVRALAAYAKLPLLFIPNAGQFDGRVRYAAQAGSSSFSFTSREAVFAIRQGKRVSRFGWASSVPTRRR